MTIGSCHTNTTSCRCGEVMRLWCQRPALAASGRDADTAWEQDSAEALKTAKKRGESHLSAARCVGRLALIP